MEFEDNLIIEEEEEEEEIEEKKEEKKVRKRRNEMTEFLINLKNGYRAYDDIKTKYLEIKDRNTKLMLPHPKDKDSSIYIGFDELNVMRSILEEYMMTGYKRSGRKDLTKTVKYTNIKRPVYFGYGVLKEIFNEGSFGKRYVKRDGNFVEDGNLIDHLPYIKNGYGLLLSVSDLLYLYFISNGLTTDGYKFDDFLNEKFNGNIKPYFIKYVEGEGKKKIEERRTNFDQENTIETINHFSKLNGLKSFDPKNFTYFDLNKMISLNSIYRKDLIKFKTELDKRFKTKAFTEASENFENIIKCLESQTENDILNKMLEESQIIRETKEYYKKISFINKVEAKINA